jgi:hypothetical protein
MCGEVMDRTEYNAICQSRGYMSLTDEDNTYMLKDAVVCEYFDGPATVYPHCVIGSSNKTGEEYVATISLNEIVATTTERFIEALNKFDMKYKEALQLIRENKLEEDFEEDDDGDM